MRTYAAFATWDTLSFPIQNGTEAGNHPGITMAIRPGSTAGAPCIIIKKLAEERNASRL